MIRREEMREPLLVDSIPERSAMRLRSQLSRPYPELTGFFNLIKAYNCRQLSYPEDALAAFSGIMSALSNKVLDGFYCGVPVMYFDIALLWQPSGILRRRVASKPTREHCFPSWSWAGWHGKLFLNQDYRIICSRSTLQNQVHKAQLYRFSSSIVWL